MEIFVLQDYNIFFTTQMMIIGFWGSFRWNHLLDWMHPIFPLVRNGTDKNLNKLVPHSGIDRLDFCSFSVAKLPAISGLADLTGLNVVI